MNDIYDVTGNLNTNLIDIKLSIYYFIGFLFLVILFYFLHKNVSKKTEVKKHLGLKEIYDKKLNLFKKNYKTYEINEFYNELNKILFLSIRLNLKPSMKDLNNKELETLELEYLFKNRLKNFYIHQFESNFDTEEYRELTYKELLEIINNIENNG